MIIRLTPVHLRVLSLVGDRQFIWSADTGPFGGFSYADGSRLTQQLRTNPSPRAQMRPAS